MCGIVAVLGADVGETKLDHMVQRLRHRGPDAAGTHRDGNVALGHTRLSIIDLSTSGTQPMCTPDQRLWLSFNGEIYNYLELRAQLGGFPFRTHTDTEVVLAAYDRWGVECLDRFVGMFAFVLWDTREQRVIAARDRFGVKPLYRARYGDGAIALASEIKALHALGVPAVPDATTWATYLATGFYDHGRRTFWDGVESVAPGSYLSWRPDGTVTTHRWYDVAERVGTELDPRPEAVVRDEYASLLADSVRLRFRSDVPVGINLSGGLDSSLLLGLVHRVRGAESDLKVFTFVTGDPQYDELPWVEQMLARTRHPLVTCPLTAEEVPELAARMLAQQDEPYGGLPTLAYAKLFARARAEGVLVLLDGQGIDEQWAGYDYYRTADGPKPTVQGARDPSVLTNLLTRELAALAETPVVATPFPDPLRNLQYRDITQTKIPRALRFNDRVSMAASTELREPFLDHRLFELALRQPADRKISGGQGKKLVRDLAAELLPEGVRTAPKRALQTPQREWLRGPLRSWADHCIRRALEVRPDWLATEPVLEAWNRYVAGVGDNSFWVWQLITIGMMTS